MATENEPEEEDDEHIDSVIKAMRRVSMASGQSSLSLGRVSSSGLKKNSSNFSVFQTYKVCEACLYVCVCVCLMYAFVTQQKAIYTVHTHVIHASFIIYIHTYAKSKDSCILIQSSHRV